MKTIQNIRFFLFSFLIFSYLYAMTYACYFSKKSELSKCIHNGIDDNDIKPVDINDLEILKLKRIRCAKLELLKEKAKYMSSNNKNEYDGDRAREFMELLESRHKIALKCIESIEKTRIDDFEKAVNCCSGKGSHFGFPPWEWKNKDYNKYYKNCMDGNNS